MTADLSDAAQEQTTDFDDSAEFETSDIDSFGDSTQDDPDNQLLAQDQADEMISVSDNDISIDGLGESE